MRFREGVSIKIAAACQNSCRCRTGRLASSLLAKSSFVPSPFTQALSLARSPGPSRDCPALIRRPRGGHHGESGVRVKKEKTRAVAPQTCRSGRAGLAACVEDAPDAPDAARAVPGGGGDSTARNTCRPRAWSRVRQVRRAQFAEGEGESNCQRKRGCADLAKAGGPGRGYARVRQVRQMRRARFREEEAEGEGTLPRRTCRCSRRSWPWVRQMR